MLSIIDRYLAKDFIAYFFAGLLVFLTIFVTIDFLTTTIRYNVPIGAMLRYYVYVVPMLLYQLIPVALLGATLFTLAGLNKNSELVAMFSLGHSLTRIATPLLVINILICLFAYWLGDRVVPLAAQKKNYIWYIEIRDKPGLYSTVKRDKIWYRSDNTIFNIQTLNPSDNSAQGITLYYFDQEGELIQLIKAKLVKMVGNSWELIDGNVTLFAQESSFPVTQKFESKTVKVSDDLEDIQTSAPSSDVLTLKELKKIIQKNKQAGLDYLKFDIDYHTKTSFPFAGFILALIGIPFTVQKSRGGGNMLNTAMAVGIAFAYWVVYSSCVSIGKNGVMPAVVAAWLPNVIGVVVATFLLVRIKK